MSPNKSRRDESDGGSNNHVGQVVYIEIRRIHRRQTPRINEQERERRGGHLGKGKSKKAKGKMKTE